MKIIRINHLGIAPKNNELATHFFTNILKLTTAGHERVEEQKVEVDFVQCENSRLEFLAPTSNESPIAKYIETKGGGIHHIALEVDNLEDWIEYLKKNNIQLIDDKPKYGAHNSKIVFIHPRSTGGILVELVEPEQS